MTTPNKKDKEALGKGIRSLLQNIDADLKTASGSLRPAIAENITGILRIPLDLFETNPKQPRKDFDDVSLQELAASIRMHDIIQPITVAKLPSGKYRIISGERRFRAGRIAGIKDIPVYIRQANDQQLLELALLENLQREDLNAMEVALSFKRMN
jgi:ParB family chromosome partitioning protein